MSVKSDMMEIIDQATTQKTSAYDSTAEVTRVEGDTIWVHLAGGVTETPVRKTISARPGDTVQVRVSGGRAWIQGNETNPPTDDTAANKAAADAVRANAAAQSAVQSATTASVAASQAVETANSVRGIAEEAAADAAAAQTSAEQAATAAATADSKATAAGTAAAAAQTSADAASAAATRAETKADTASAAASRAETAAGNAETSAANAQSSADSALVGLSTVQDVVGVLDWITAHGTMASQSGGTFDANQVYFIQDNNGDYTVGGVRYSLVAEPKAADINSYYVLSVDESVQNYVATHIVVDSEGLWIIPDAGGNKVLIATGNGSTYTTAGTYIIGKVNNVDTIFAKFSKDGATITAENGVQIAHLGYGETYAPSGLTNYPFYTLGNRRTTITPFDSTESYKWGAMCVYNGHIYVCVSEQTSPGAWNRDDWKYYIGAYSHARGWYVTSCGVFSIADGEQVMALGNTSHAVGSGTRAIGEESSAEGKETFAIGKDSHAEGDSTRARGIASHAEGSDTVARGDYSHAQNRGTVAAEDNQTAIGKYNDNKSNTAFEIGNGTNGNSRSNAFTVDWEGNTEAAGDITDGSENVLADKADSSSLATVATSGSYNDLLDKPTIPTASQQVWYGTSSTSASTATKVVTTSTGDFDFKAGNALYVRFTNGNTSSSNLSVTVDGTTKSLYFGNGRTGEYYWGAYEVLALVYSGSYFYVVNQGLATTSYYGMTKLEDSTSSTSTSTAATPNSVKQAYDLANSANDYEELTVTKVGSYYTSGTIVAIKRGGTVTVHVNALAVKKLTARTTVASIPAQYAPKKESYGIMTASSSIKYFIVSTDGEIRFNTGDAGTFYSTLTYVYGE